MSKKISSDRAAAEYAKLKRCHDVELPGVSYVV
jgi:hypothetical protein